MSYGMAAALQSAVYQALCRRIRRLVAWWGARSMMRSRRADLPQTYVSAWPRRRCSDRSDKTGSGACASVHRVRGDRSGRFWWGTRRRPRRVGMRWMDADLTLSRGAVWWGCGSSVRRPGAVVRPGGFGALICDSAPGWKTN